MSSDIDSYVYKHFLRVKNVYKGFKFAIDPHIQKKLDLISIINELGGEARLAESNKTKHDEINVTLHGEYGTWNYNEVFNHMYENKAFRVSQ